jgi:hypothetical protein
MPLRQEILLTVPTASTDPRAATERAAVAGIAAKVYPEAWHEAAFVRDATVPSVPRLARSWQTTG